MGARLPLDAPSQAAQRRWAEDKHCLLFASSLPDISGLSQSPCLSVSVCMSYLSVCIVVGLYSVSQKISSSFHLEEFVYSFGLDLTKLE